MMRRYGSYEESSASLDFRFNSYCLTAIIDERQATAANMMEKLAEQLRMKGEFERALNQYKDTLRRLHTEQERMGETLLQKAPDIAGATVEGIPFAGPVLREGAKFTAAHLLKEHRTSQLHRDAEQLENPIDSLTKAFVAELNRIADAKVTVIFSRQKRQRRIILLLDTFEQLAKEAVPWLLDHFLEAPISNNVVLVIAGRDPIEHSTPNDPKRWLPYYDSGTIYSITLNSFTEDETHAYLAERGITDPARIATIWQLSRGLPLYLGLLTSGPGGGIDPTKDVVDNFLRWIPEHEHIKRQVAIQAALFSRPFNLDDLAAFTYLPEHERLALYHWLTRHPFVRPRDGRYIYHDLARELFSRYLYQRSKNEYYATRRSLAHFYQESLEKIPLGNRKVRYSAEWLELSLALVSQLLLLPDESSHIKAIEQILYSFKHRNSQEQEIQIAGILRELSREQSNYPALMSAKQTSINLQQIIEINRDLLSITDRRGIIDGNQKLLTAVDYLLEKVVDTPLFPAELLAYLYEERGGAFEALNDYEEALKNFERTIEINSNYASVYAERGVAHRKHGAYQLAIEDFNRAIELNPDRAFAYAQRGMTYSSLKEYQRAIEDFDHALSISNKAAWIYINRGGVYQELKEYQRAIEDLLGEA